MGTNDTDKQGITILTPSRASVLRMTLFQGEKLFRWKVKQRRPIIKFLIRRLLLSIVNKSNENASSHNYSFLSARYQITIEVSIEVIKREKVAQHAGMRPLIRQIKLSEF